MTYFILMHTQPWTAPAGTVGLIFDCDGTLADTMPAHYKAWTAMLGRFGIPFPEPRFYAMGGMPTATIIRVLAGEASVVVGARSAPGKGSMPAPAISLSRPVST